MIPQLRTAFCGCSVRTGTKVIGWLTLVLGILEFISITAVIGILAFTVSATDDEKIGSGAIKVLHNSEKEDVKNLEGMQALHYVMMMLVGDVDEDAKPEDIGRQVKQQLEGIFTLIFIIVLAIFFIHVLLTSLLLVGAYKKKSGYILFYLVFTTLGLMAYLPVVFSGSLSFDLRITTLTGFLVHLYFTWVIYSFYRELRSSSAYPANSMVMLLPGQKHLEGDVPIHGATAVPNDYYYHQKK